LIHPTAEVSPRVPIAASTKVWNFTQIRENSIVGSNCTIGRFVYIGPGVVIGDNCKIQNNALIYEPARLANGVFIGPAAVLTNDQYPRAVNTDGTRKNISDWESVGVTVEEGASVGANAVCVAPVTIGKWALVAAGSVVTRDVPEFALVAGSPARRIAWVGKSGFPLRDLKNGKFECPSTGTIYMEKEGKLSE